MLKFNYYKVYYISIGVNMLSSLKLSLILILFTIISCESTTEPVNNDGSFTGITETDEYGDLIGNFDFDDWTLPNRFFGNKVEIKPNTNIRFSINYIGGEGISYIKFENFYTREYKLDFSEPSSPFSINRSSLDLPPFGRDSLRVSFILPDTTTPSFVDSLVITNQYNETVGIRLSGSWDDPNDNLIPGPGLNITYTFLPAYPNPATDSTILSFTNIELDTVNLMIIDKDENIVKILINSQPKSAGYYQVLWDLLDESGIRVVPAIYRAVLDIGTFHSHGDILVH